MRTRTVLQRMVMAGMVVGLMGCASSQRYNATVHSWRGAPMSALVQKWGQPDQVNQLKNGNQVYSYRKLEQGSAVAPKNYTPVFARVSTQSTGGATLSMPSAKTSIDQPSFWCETSFEINRQSMIVNTDTEGNDCTVSKNRAARLFYRP